MRIGIGWYGGWGKLRRRPGPLSRDGVVWAVRRDWPDGSHEFVRPRTSRQAAEGELSGDAAYWRNCHLKPRLSVVQLSGHEFRLHGRARRFCKAPDCPVVSARETAGTR